MSGAVVSTPCVSLEPCGRCFRHAQGGWHIVLPLERLASWTAHYRRLRDRKRGRYAQHYAADVEALERFAATVEGKGQSS